MLSEAKHLCDGEAKSMQPTDEILRSPVPSLSSARASLRMTGRLIRCLSNG